MHVHSSSNPFLDFGQDALAPLAVVAAPGTEYATGGAAPSRQDAEIALHSRLNAAVLDHILIGLLIGGLALALQLTFSSAPFLALAVAVELSYFFIQETASGQTIGKRRNGVRVVMLDGTRPGPRAIAMRTLGRLLDGLPAYHASGLLTMMGTGRRHRQRIGDYIARTTVISAHDGHVLARRRAWLLPLLTLVATAMSAAVIVSIVSAASAPASLRAGFVAGCERSGSTAAYCGCVYDQVAAAGYTTTADWQALDRQALAARAAGNPQRVPPVLLSAVRRCQGS